MDIIKVVQENLGFGALSKIDPNTEQVPKEKQEMGKNALAQAGIPAILLGIFAKLEQNPNWILPDTTALRSLNKIFGSDTAEVIGKIEDYARIPDSHAAQELEHIAAECTRVIRKTIGENSDPTVVHQFINHHKPIVLQYLLPGLGLGILLKNNNLDDRTGKMTGPVSGFMHLVEKVFNT